MGTKVDVDTLKKKAQGRIREALDRGCMEEVMKLAAAVQELDNASRAHAIAAERIASALSVASPQDAAANPLDTHPQRATGATITKNARGKACRDTYIRKLSTGGIRLFRVKGRIYEATSGRKVGIAYASEVLADKWWMGLLDEEYDVVVLLCEPRSGDVLDFVLPTDFVRKAWPLLSRNGKSREMHVHRVGVNYELEPGKGLGKINQYLSSIAELA
jgi:hypothetical protein